MGRGSRDTIVYKINKLQGCTVQHRELYLMHFGVLNKRETQKGRCKCICMAVQ